MMQQDRLIQNRIHRAFRRAEEQLLKSLTARKGEVKASLCCKNVLNFSRNGVAVIVGILGPVQSNLDYLDFSIISPCFPGPVFFMNINKM